MKILVLKDGTVPIMVAEILYTDYDEREDDRIGDIEHEYAEVFEVGGRPEALDVTWADGEGFSVGGITVADWFKYRQEDSPPGGPIEVVAEGHYVQSDISHGDDERWYSHLFDLRRHA